MTAPSSSRSWEAARQPPEVGHSPLPSLPNLTKYTNPKVQRMWQEVIVKPPKPPKPLPPRHLYLSWICPAKAGCPTPSPDPKPSSMMAGSVWSTFNLDHEIHLFNVPYRHTLLTMPLNTRLSPTLGELPTMWPATSRSRSTVILSGLPLSLKRLSSSCETSSRPGRCG